MRNNTPFFFQLYLLKKSVLKPDFLFVWRVWSDSVVRLFQGVQSTSVLRMRFSAVFTILLFYYFTISFSVTYQIVLILVAACFICICFDNIFGNYAFFCLQRFSFSFCDVEFASRFCRWFSLLRLQLLATVWIKAKDKLKKHCCY